jgi:hypothetical protein
MEVEYPPLGKVPLPCDIDKKVNQKYGCKTISKHPVEDRFLLFGKVINTSNKEYINQNQSGTSGKTPFFAYGTKI